MAKVKAVIQTKLQSRSILAVTLILAPLILSFALALDIYVPSIPAIKAYFDASQSTVQLTVSLFLLVTGIGQLFIGPLSDQMGRTPIMFSSIVLFIFGSAICALAVNIQILILGRVVQALGACGMMVSSFAIVRDLFSGNDCAKIYSFLNSAMAFSPILGPVIGGYLETWFNWRAAFITLGLLALLVLISSKIMINETLASHKRKKLTTELVNTYKHIIKQKPFVMYTACASLGFAGFLTFFSSSSYIIISLLHVSSAHFGFYFAFMGLMFAIGSIVSGFVAKKRGTFFTVLLGSALMLLSGICMLLWYWYFGLSMFGLMGPMMIMGVGGAMLMGAGAGGAIEPFGDMSGTASALFSCAELVLSFLITSFILQWTVTSTLPLALTLTSLGALSIICCVTLNKKD